MISFEMVTRIAPWLSVLVATGALYISARQNQIGIFKNIIDEIGSEDVRRIRSKLASDGAASLEEGTRICVAYDRVAFYILSHSKIPILGRHMIRLFEDLHGDSISQFGPTLFRVLLTIRTMRKNQAYCRSLETLLKRYDVKPVPLVGMDDGAA